ncbi:hypothetical protein RSK20926_11854 [Roseobacter sp. SK209-2-6]|nr:hypothetical protein RSK20926_11854 [Roseobacter sp. SK209-2-6]
MKGNQMNWNDLFLQLQPHLLSLAALILTVVIGRVAQVLKVRFGIDIEQRHRENLHSALMSGLRAALSRRPEAEPPQLIEEAIAYARDSVPDAMARLGPSEAVLGRLALGKLQEIAPAFGR